MSFFSVSGANVWQHTPFSMSTPLLHVWWLPLWEARVSWDTKEMEQVGPGTVVGKMLKNRPVLMPQQLHAGWVVTLPFLSLQHTHESRHLCSTEVNQRSLGWVIGTMDGKNNISKAGQSVRALTVREKIPSFSPLLDATDSRRKETRNPFSGYFKSIDLPGQTAKNPVDRWLK